MLSRLTNVILLLAVVVLAVSLVRANERRHMAESRHSTSSLDAASAMVIDGSDSYVFALAGWQSTEPLNGEAQRERKWDSGIANRGEGSLSRGRPAFAEMADRCLEVAEEVDPMLAARLREAREHSPEEFESQMRSGFGRRLWSLAQLKTHEPRLYDDKIAELSIALQIERVAGQLREVRRRPDASLGDMSSLEGKLRALVQVQLALSIKARGEMLCRFEEKARELHDELDREARHFQATVEARVSALMDGPADLGIDDESTGHTTVGVDG